MPDMGSLSMRLPAGRDSGQMGAMDMERLRELLAGFPGVTEEPLGPQVVVYMVVGNMFVAVEPL